MLSRYGGNLSFLAIDIGCGTGRFTKLLENAYARSPATCIVGIDINLTALKRVRQKKINAWLVQGELQNLPFHSEISDTILLLEVLEHTEDEKKGLREIQRVLKPKGKLIISVPCLPAAYPDRAHKRQGYTKEQIFELLKSIGFKIVSYKFCIFRISRIMLKFVINFMSIFRFSPPILIILNLENWLKLPPPFDIIVEIENP